MPAVAEVHADVKVHSIHQPLTTAVSAASGQRATSVLLQGNLHSVSNLFLVPPTLSTPDIFAPIPPIDPNRVAVFGLRSPLATNSAADQHHADAAAASITIPELASLYVAEIQRRQPHGPYSLLGYSAGGIVAYEAARQLIVQREAVERIYLVDAPCPLVVPSLSSEVVEFVDSVLEGQTRGAEEASVKPVSSLRGTQLLGSSLGKYVPMPLPSSPGHPSPKTTYYVAKEGLDSRMTFDRPFVSERDEKGMAWLLNDRKGLGASGDGWERLVDKAKLKIVPVEGNHFSIMREPYIWEWATQLRSLYWDSSFPFKIRSVRRR